MVRRFSRPVIWFLVGAVAIFLLFSFLGFWLPLADSVAHFRFHLTAIMVFAAVVLFALRDRRAAGFACAASVFGVIGMAPALPTWNAAEARAGETPITVVQLNLLFRNNELEAVAGLIRDEGADVVTLQEVTKKTGRLLKILQKEYPYSVLCRFATVGGVAVLSRLPLAPGVSRGCADKGGLAWLRVMAGGRALSVASIHLHWPYPYRQPAQLDRLQPHLEAIPRPALVAGDFNAAPWSHAVARVADATGTTVAGGLRFTFGVRPIRWAPAVAMPIDHILLPDDIAPLDVRSVPAPGSDHASLVARLALLPEPD